MIITLEADFSAAHFYAQPKWNTQKNREAFGKCYSKFGHGHNYKLQVSFERASYFLEDKNRLQATLMELTQTLDHHHLNLVIPEFKKEIPTTENIAVYFERKLKEKLPQEKITSIKLFETADLWTEINYER